MYLSVKLQHTVSYRAITVEEVDCVYFLPKSSLMLALYVDNKIVKKRALDSGFKTTRSKLASGIG